MLFIEKIAGGPVYVGNSVVHIPHPNLESKKHGFYFWIPPELDDLYENWRELANGNVKKLGMNY